MRRALVIIGLIFLLVVFVFSPLTLLAIWLLNGLTSNLPVNIKTVVEAVSGLAGLFLIVAELCAIVIAGLGWYRYSQLYRRSNFIFKGFSNTSKLTEVDNIPIDFDNLARGELAYQIRLIHEKLDTYYSNKHHLEKSNGKDISISDLYVEDERLEDKDGWPLPDPKIERGILGTNRAKRLIYYLEQTMKNIKNNDLSDLINNIERSAPQKIAAIISFIDMIFPPRAIMVTCHLQWGDSGSNGIGIMFEVTDSKKQGGVSFVQTIWSGSIISVYEHKKLTERYIELLKPAMRWLGLLFWEQEILLNISKKDKKSLLAAFFYLFGVLCYHSADQFLVCSNFFSQQAIHRLSKVTSRYPKLSLPYFIRAEIDVWKAEQMRNRNKDDARLWYQQAIHDYEQAIRDYEQAIHGHEQALTGTQRKGYSQVSKNLIIIRRASVVNELNDRCLFREADQQVKKMIKEGIPTTFDSESGGEECSLYLSTLAAWYVDLARAYKGDNEQKEEESKTRARRYLIYSFVRNSPLWYNEEKEASSIQGFSDEDLKYLFGVGSKELYEKLGEILEKNRQKVSALATMLGTDFSDGVRDLFSQWKIDTSASV